MKQRGLQLNKDKSVCVVMGSKKQRKETSLEIAQIVNDRRSQVVGGMESAILLWEACCIPSLLHGAGTWVEMSDQTEQFLN